MEVVLAVSLGILLIVGATSVFTSYRAQANISRAKMWLSGARSNITMYRYRTGAFPTSTVFCSNNTGDATNPRFFPGTVGNDLPPADPVKGGTNCVTGTTIPSPVASPAGGWLYGTSTGDVRINLPNDTAYGTDEEQPQPTASPQVGGW